VKSLYYKLNGKQPVPCESLDEGAVFLKGLNRVGKTVVGNCLVLTVFLGLDHGWGFTERPILFETMVFGGFRLLQSRYATWEEAEAGHRDWVEAIQSILAERAMGFRARILNGFLPRFGWVRGQGLQIVEWERTEP
jgi:hypothetical protein